jgi:hypothetical protein
MAGELMHRLHGLAAAAVVAPVARGRQVRHGQLVYESVPELWRSAVDNVIENGLPLTPSNIRESAESIINWRTTMIQDDLGVNYDELGHPIRNRDLI